MPARKPQDLHTRHATKAEKAARAADEAALKPRAALPLAAPARLKDHDVASTTWRRVIRTYAELEAEIVNRLDMDLLIDYCLLTEQLGELDTMRKVAYQAWLEISSAHAALVELGQVEDAVFMAIKVVGAFDAVLKLDARSEQKRKTLHQWRQSLYLTPRSRAGVAPSKKEVEPPPDDMEQLLSDVDTFVNGGQ